MATLLSSLRRNAEFVYPGRSVPRTAVLVPWFSSPSEFRSNWSSLKVFGAARPKEPVRIFDDGWSQAVAEFAPSAIAATPTQIGLLTLSGIPSLRHAVVALTRLEEPRLSESDHGRLWAAFRVPVFEQIIGERGKLLATECEAHAGLHIEIPQADSLFRDRKVRDQEIDHAQCGCGRKTPRLVLPGRLDALKSVAAYAR